MKKKSLVGWIEPGDLKEAEDFKGRSTINIWGESLKDKTDIKVKVTIEELLPKRKE